MQKRIILSLLVTAGGLFLIALAAVVLEPLDPAAENYMKG